MDLYIYQALGAAFIFALSATCFKWSAHHNGVEQHFLLGLYATGSCLFFISSFYVENGRFDHLDFFNFPPAMIIGGVLIGMGSAVGNFFFVKALKAGPASLTVALAKANIILVIAMSYFFYDETIGVMKIIGILCVSVALGSASISSKRGKEPEAEIHIEGKWLIFIFGIILFFSVRNGGIKVTNEMGYGGEFVLWIAYAACAFSFLFITLLNPKRLKFDFRAFWIGILGGIFSASGLYLYMTALKNGPASVVVTIFSLDMIFVLWVTHVIFHERLSRLQKFGFVMSLIGFIFIGV